MRILLTASCLVLALVLAGAGPVRADPPSGGVTIIDGGASAGKHAPMSKPVEQKQDDNQDYMVGEELC